MRSPGKTAQKVTWYSEYRLSCCHHKIHKRPQGRIARWPLLWSLIITWSLSLANCWRVCIRQVQMVAAAAAIWSLPKRQSWRVGDRYANRQVRLIRVNDFCVINKLRHSCKIIRSRCCLWSQVFSGEERGWDLTLLQLMRRSGAEIAIS